MQSRRGDGTHGKGGWLRFWSANNCVRLMLTLELAVMLPAAALIYVNFNHLKSIRRDKALEAAIHRDFLQMLAISEKQINLKAYKMVDEVRELFPCPDVDDQSARVRKLDEILSKRPWAAHAFFFDADTGLVFRSPPQRMSDPDFLAEHQRLAKMVGGWFAFEGKTLLEGLHKKARPITWIAEHAKRASGNAYVTTAIFSLPKLSKDRVVMGGITLEPDYLSETFFPKMLEELI